jgi:hypothetical protein
MTDGPMKWQNSEMRSNEKTDAHLSRLGIVAFSSTRSERFFSIGCLAGNASQSNVPRNPVKNSMIVLYLANVPGLWGTLRLVPGSTPLVYIKDCR